MKFVLLSAHSNAKLIFYVFSTIFTVSIVGAYTSMIREDDNCCFDRCKIMKVTQGELILSHFLIQLTVLIINLTTTLWLVFYGLEATSEGSLELVAFICFLTGLFGVVIGNWMFKIYLFVIVGSECNILKWGPHSCFN